MAISLKLYGKELDQTWRTQRKRLKFNPTTNQPKQTQKKAKESKRKQKKAKESKRKQKKEERGREEGDTLRPHFSRHTGCSLF
jgi:ribosomal protein L12E/L44/L45/RPP1/RPP2